MTEPRRPLCVEPVSLELAWNDPGENLRRVNQAIEDRLGRSAVPSEERLFLFPELTLTGFVTKAPKPVDIAPLRALAVKHKTAIAAGFPDHDPKDARRPLNALALIGPDGRDVARYHKLHLFTVGDNPESAAYAAGSAGSVCVYRGWRIGFAICFDLRFPSLFHEYAKAEVDLLLVASCWIGGPHKSEQYRTLGSAYANLAQAYLASVNRSGKDPFYEYDGSEYVFSPFGENVWTGKPVALEPGALEACRRMSVRSADRPSYPIRRP